VGRAVVIAAAATLTICISYLVNVGYEAPALDVSIIGWGVLPVLLFALATFRPRVSPTQVLVLGLLTLAYAGLFVLATLDYDASSTGGLVYVFLPLWGIVALALGWLVFTAWGAWSVWRETRKRGGRFGESGPEG
jgi:hypothetical protein